MNKCLLTAEDYSDAQVCSACSALTYCLSWAYAINKISEIRMRMANEIILLFCSAFPKDSSLRFWSQQRVCLKIVKCSSVPRIISNTIEILNSDAAPNNKHILGSYRGSTYYSETHIITNTMMQQNKWFNDELKPEHMKATNYMTMVCWPNTFIERLPVHHHSADYISLPLGSLGPWYIWKWSSALEGVSTVANFITAYEESQ